MKLVVWTVAALAVVFGGWKLMEARDIASWGIDGSHPFGSFEKLDAKLTGEMGFTKSEGLSEAVPYEDLPEAVRTYRYMDSAHADGGFADKVWLQVGADGGLISVSAWSRPSYTGVFTFMRDYWSRVTGERVVTDRGQGEAAGAGWRGRWTWGKPGGFLVCVAVR